MLEPEQLTDRRFGRLVVTGFADYKVYPGGAKQARWYCRCDCGKAKVISGCRLRNGNTTSCGCRRTEVTQARSFRHGHALRGSLRREYRAWGHAKSRCVNVNDKAYGDYGGRGIHMCAEWIASYSTFIRDMGPCPPGYELDRVDNNGNYEPGNCRWATRQAQMNNVRRNRYVELIACEGQKVLVEGRISIADACRYLGMSADCVYQRLSAGWSLGRALALPANG